MTIGIDVSQAFLAQKTGTERYAYETLRAILKLPQAGQHSWRLYVKSLPQTFDVTGSHWSFVVVPLPRLWTQVGLAYRTWVDNLDVLWIPAHTLPVLGNPQVKTVVTVHGLEYAWLPSFRNLFQRYYLPFSTWFVAKRASHLIAVSEFTKRELVTRLGVESRKISVVYEGVSPSSVPPLNLREGKGGDILNKYDLKPKQYILTVGTIQPRKNLRRLIAAFSRLDASRYTLAIVGKLGWDYAGDLQAPEEFGVVGRVRFLNYITDDERLILLQNALLYVQASITEGFGLPVIEAMQTGVPVVSSTGGALREIIGDAGVLFDPLDIGQVSHSLSLVIDSHKLQKELVAKGKKRVEEFDWDIAARKTYNVLTNK